MRTRRRLSLPTRIEEAKREFQRYKEAGDYTSAAGTAAFIATALSSIGHPGDITWAERGRECERLARVAS